MDILDKKNIKLYSKLVEETANNNENRVILNNSHSHSQITLGNILRTTKREIYIYTTGFRKEIESDDYSFKKYLEQVLKTTKTVKIIIDEQSNTNVSQLIRKYQTLRKENVMVRLMNKPNVKEEFNKHFEKIKDNLNISCNDFHVQTADGKMLRLEYDYQNKKAFVNFNHPETAKGYQAVFEVAFNKLEPYNYE